MNFEDRVVTVVAPLIKSIEDMMLESDKAQPSSEACCEHILASINVARDEIITAVKSQMNQPHTSDDEDDEEKKEEKKRKRDALKETVRDFIDEDGDGSISDDIAGKLLSNQADDRAIATLKVIERIVTHAMQAVQTGQLIKLQSDISSLRKVVKQTYEQAQGNQELLDEISNVQRNFVDETFPALNNLVESVSDALTICCRNMNSKMDNLQDTADYIKDKVDAFQPFDPSMISGMFDSVLAQGSKPSERGSPTRQSGTNKTNKNTSSRDIAKEWEEVFTGRY